MTTTRRIRIEAATPRSRVTVLELFFDLVFVYAMTQVTALLAADLSLLGMIRGLLVLAVLWWCWVGYSWLGNVARADEGVVRLAMFVAMGGVLAMALATREAFDDAPGGLSGPVVFALGYLVVRAVHLALFWQVGRGDPGLRRQLLRVVPGIAAGTLLLLLAAQLDGVAQLTLWAVALLTDYGLTYASGSNGWRLTSPGHFSERHGLVIILALGESIAVIGVGAADYPVSGPVLAAAALGLAIACALWWMYFDVVSVVAGDLLAQVEGVQRTRLARDSYTYLHLPMIAGIVLAALGVEEVLHHVAEAAGEGGALSAEVPALAALALPVGVALYLLSHVAFRWRNVRRLSVRRAGVAGLLLLAVAPTALLLPALGVLSLVAAVAVGLVAFEAVRFAEQRYEIRHAERAE